MNKQTQILGTTKTDVLQIDPRNIEVEAGFNGRTDFPEDEQKELIDSIRASGVQVPILVKKIRGTDKFTLVNGERRLRACMWLIEHEGREMRIKANTFNGNEMDAVISMLVTNDNVPLNLIEEAGVIYRLSQYNLSAKEIGAKTGRKPAYVAHLLKLNELPEDIRKWIASNAISSRLVIKIFKDNEDWETACSIINKAIEGNSSTNVLGETKVKKVTEKAITGKSATGSFSQLNSVFKLAEKKGYVVNPEKKELHKYLSQINSGKKTKDQILKELFLTE